jgi:hypothetical protein
MKLDPGFQFSQSSLQNYVDCPRGFQLRYLQHVAWPAVAMEPFYESERFRRQGERFHHMAQQHLSGVPAERLAAMLSAAAEPQIVQWWQSYCAFVGTLDLPARSWNARRVELALAAPLAGCHLVAKYDLILFESSGCVRIFDWKTGLKRPDRVQLAARLQTRVYPFVLVGAGGVINGGQNLIPDQVEMIYWYAAHPQSPQRFAYSPEQYRADENYLAGLITEIACCDEDAFPMTESGALCSYCNYRSLCGRTAEMAPVGGELEMDDWGKELDLEAILPIEF